MSGDVGVGGFTPTGLQRRLLNLIIKSPGKLGNRELSQLTGWAESTVANNMRAMVAAGRVVRGYELGEYRVQRSYRYTARP